MKSHTKAYVKYLTETPKVGGRPYSPITIRNRSYMVDRLKEPITLESVNDFIKKNIKHQSMARFLGHFLAFHLFGNTDKDTVERITKIGIKGVKLYIPPTPKPKYLLYEKILTVEEKEKLINESPKPFNFIFRLLFDTMLRKAELLAINLEDINFEEKSIILRSIKGGYEDVCFFHDSTKQMFLEYLKENDIKKGKVFPQFSPYTFWYRVNKVAKNTIGKKFNPHWCRHTECQIMTDRGNPKSGIKERGRWHSDQVLNKYSSSSKASRQKAFQNYSEDVPLSNEKEVKIKADTPE